MRQRGEFIRSRMMDIALREAAQGKGQEFFDSVDDFISNVSTGTGNIKNIDRLKDPQSQAGIEVYRRAIEAWRGIYKDRRENAKSKFARA